MLLPVLLFLSAFADQSLRCKTDSDCPSQEYTCQPTGALLIYPPININFRCIKLEPIRNAYGYEDGDYAITTEAVEPDNLIALE